MGQWVRGWLGVVAMVMTDTKLNAIHQPFGPAFVGGEAGYASKGAYIGGPHPTWKALLKPAAAGGNYTITAACTGCTEDGSFSKVNISDVTFGDVWHCSGQVKEPPHTRRPTPVDASSQRRRPAAPACPPLSVPMLTCMRLPSSLPRTFGTTPKQSRTCGYRSAAHSPTTTPSPTSRLASTTTSG